MIDDKDGKISVALIDFESCQKLRQQPYQIVPEDSSCKNDLISLCLLITHILNGR